MQKYENCEVGLIYMESKMKNTKTNKKGKKDLYGFLLLNIFTRILLYDTRSLVSHFGIYIIRKIITILKEESS